jgi:hypothetical protein
MTPSPSLQIEVLRFADQPQGIVLAWPLALLDLPGMSSIYGSGII